MLMVGKGKERGAALVLLSGGLDSMACIHFLQSQNFQVSTFHVNYGQPASLLEKKCSEEIANYFGTPLELCQVRASGHVMEGEIQGRNSFLIFCALTLAEQSKGIVALGTHSGTSYYDCSSAYFKKVSSLVAESTNGKVTLLAPFADWTKLEIYKYCQQHKLPINLTYSCERGTLPPCGICLSCKDRKGLECY